MLSIWTSLKFCHLVKSERTSLPHDLDIYDDLVCDLLPVLGSNVFVTVNIEIGCIVV